MMHLVAVFVGCWYRGSNCSGEREEGLIVTTLLRADITDQSHLGFQEPQARLAGNNIDNIILSTAVHWVKQFIIQE